jgi:PleD family two-component response regulator
MSTSAERIIVFIWAAVGVGALVVGAIGEADDRVMRPLAVGGVVAAICFGAIVATWALRPNPAQAARRIADLEQAVIAQNSIETELQRTVHDAAAAAAGGSGAITDADSGLLNETYLRAALVGRVHNARRHLRPLAYCIVHVGSEPDSPEAHEPSAKRIAAILDETLRDADTSTRLDDGRFGLLLEDTPEDGAVWTIERVRRNVTEQLPGATVWAGVATYPVHATDSDELAAMARDALARAREWTQSRIEVAARLG